MPDDIAEPQRAGVFNAGVDPDAAFVVLGEMAQQSGIGGGGFGIERHDAAARDAFEDAELWAVFVPEMQDVAGEGVFGEGLRVRERKHEVGAEAQRIYRAAAFVVEGLQAGLRDEGDGANVKVGVFGGVFQVNPGAGPGCRDLERVEQGG